MQEELLKCWKVKSEKEGMKGGKEKKKGEK